jgi:group I intron endonuclease
MVTYIYVLKCPRTNEVRYVGKSNDPKRRYYGHMRTDKTACSYKKNWVQSLLKQGLKPVLEIIKEVPMGEWKDWEKYYIRYYKEKGCKLTNLGQGGEGLHFGNQTSFKKGQKAHNKGKGGVILKCAICGKKFKVSPSAKNKYKCCSTKCTLSYRSLYPNKGVFKKGVVPWNKNKKGINLNNKSSKPVEQVDKLTGKVIVVFPSAAEAERKTGICQRNITNNTSGSSKSAGGYIWRKKEK